MVDFTPWSSLLGGLLIGVAAVGLMLFNGKVAGISGILADSFIVSEGSRWWRWAFLGGLLLGGLVAVALSPAVFESTLERSAGALILAGGLVGVGTQLGGGCTSGHGVCGIGRLSKRSIVATVTFMATGALTVLATSQLFGGAL